MERYGTTLTKSLLSHGDFKSISRTLEYEIQTYQLNHSSINDIYTEMQEYRSSNKKIPDSFLQNVKKLINQNEEIQKRIQKGLEDLESKALNERHKRVHFELDLKNTQNLAEFKMLTRSYFGFLSEEETLKKRYSVVSEAGSSARSEADVKVVQEMPEREVYDQEKFIEERDAKVKKMKEEAKDINEIATDIVVKIEDQDKKLDQFNRKNEKIVKDLKGANEDLNDAAKRTQNGNKGWKCVLIVGIFVVFLVVVLYFVIFKKDD